MELIKNLICGPTVVASMTYPRIVSWMRSEYLVARSCPAVQRTRCPEPLPLLSPRNKWAPILRTLGFCEGCDRKALSLVGYSSRFHCQPDRPALQSIQPSTSFQPRTADCFM